MESAKSRAIFAALLRLLLDCSRQCLGSMKDTEQAMQHERRFAQRRARRQVQGVRSSKREQICGKERAGKRTDAYALTRPDRTTTAG